MMTMDTYRMRGEKTCGPDAFAFAAEISPECAMALFQWKQHGGLREDIQDSPLHHFYVLRQTGRPWRMRTCGQILSGDFKPNKVVCLLHLYDKNRPGWLPSFFERLWWAITGTLYQHWMVIRKVEGGKVFLHWGNGTIREFTAKQFARMYSVGSPACAYEIDAAGDRELSWWERSYVRVTNFFA